MIAAMKINEQSRGARSSRRQPMRQIFRAALCALMAAAIVAPMAAQESAPLPVGDVNAFDRAVMFPYSAPLDAVSDYTQYAAFLSPAAFAFAAPAGDWFEVGAMYAGSAVLSYAARTALKAAIERNRPYMYFADPPSRLVEEGDHLDSFPSGHSIMAFTGAGFTAALFALRYPGSPYGLPATVGAYGLAAATVGLRVGSGSHFLTDVAAGAAIGSLFGILVPYAADRLGWLD